MESQCGINYLSHILVDHFLSAENIYEPDHADASLNTHGLLHLIWTQACTEVLAFSSYLLGSCAADTADGLVHVVYQARVDFVLPVADSVLGFTVRLPESCLSLQWFLSIYRRVVERIVPLCFHVLLDDYWLCTVRAEASVRG